MARLWQLVVPPAVTPHTVPEAEQYVRWLRLAATLKAQAPEQLEELGFPDAYLAQLHALLVVPLHGDVAEASGSLRGTVAEALELLVAISPQFRARAYFAWTELRKLEPPRDPAPEPQPYAVRSETPPNRWSLVHRILADLG